MYTGKALAEGIVDSLCYGIVTTVLLTLVIATFISFSLL